jgi:PAS domain S-box-containing protein
VLASAEAAESAVERLLVLTGLLILLGGGGALWVGARRSRRREGEFLRNERQLREIAESVSGVFWIMDRDRSRTLYVSPGYAELWGRPAEELGRDPDAWLEGVHADDRDRVRNAWQGMGTATSEVQFRVVTPAGEVRRVRSRAFPIHDEDGDVVRIMGFVEDITLRQELEHEIVRSQNLKSVGRLAGGVAHEFNNLLTVAQGHLQLLIADHPDEPATVADLEEALKATQRAGELTRDLLSFVSC